MKFKKMTVTVLSKFMNHNNNNMRFINGDYLYDHLISDNLFVTSKNETTNSPI